MTWTKRFESAGLVMNLNDITVVVPTKNEQDNIEDFLGSLHPDAKLIVVDASTDATREIALRTRPTNTEILEDQSNIATARQLGAERATTPWLLFTDCDMVFDRNYFDMWSSLTLADRVGVLQGAKLSADESYSTYYRLFSFGIGLLARLNLPAGSGSNVIVRSSAFEEVGGFDLALDTNEDTDLLWRVRSAGWRVVYERNLKVYERDHRRLDEGVLRKTVHSWARSLMLMTGLGSRWVRKSDWGYWRNRDLAGHGQTDSQIPSFDPPPLNDPRDAPEDH